jgi:superkiller protein 3
MQDKRAHDAVLLLEMGAELNPDAAWLRHLLGDALLADGDREGALASYERALALNPENSFTRKKVEDLKAPPKP